MIKNILTPLVTLALLTFLQSTALAVEYQSPRTLALGGSGRAAPLLNDAIYLNPSYGSFVPSYSLATGWNWYDQGHNYNVSVQDSRTELFQAGAGFTHREQNSAINIGASKQVIQRLGVGIGSKTIIDNGTNQMHTDFMYSTSFIATQWMYASIVIDNLIDNSDFQARNMYRNFFAAFKFIPTKEVQFFLDPLYTPNYPNGAKGGFSLGMEIGLMADFYLRAGRFQHAEVSFMDTRGEGFGLGLGWIGPKMNVDYSMNRVTGNDNQTPLTTSHSVALTLYF